MKKHIICLIAASVSLLTSCYKEDVLVPSQIGGVATRFEFPQGTNAWDVTAKEIYDNFGVYLIYKDIDTLDLNRNWGGTSYYAGMDLTDEQAEFQINFMKTHIFDYLTPAITKKVLKTFYYQLSNYYYLSYNTKYDLTNYYNGIDFWAFSIFKTQDSQAPTAAQMREYRVRIMRTILEKACNKGNIAPGPAAFFNLFDFSTPIVTYDWNSSDKNYYKKRGFPGMLGDDSFNLLPSLPYNASIASFTREYTFILYLFMGIRYSPEELEAAFPKATYGTIHTARDMVVSYMKTNYNIDLEAIQTGPTE